MESQRGKHLMVLNDFIFIISMLMTIQDGKLKKKVLKEIEETLQMMLEVKEEEITGKTEVTRRDMTQKSTEDIGI